MGDLERIKNVGDHLMACQSETCSRANKTIKTSNFSHQLHKHTMVHSMNKLHAFKENPKSIFLK